MSELNDQPPEVPEMPSSEVGQANHEKALHALRVGIDDADTHLLDRIAVIPKTDDEIDADDFAPSQDERNGLIERFVADIRALFPSFPEDELSQIEHEARVLIASMQDIYKSSVRDLILETLHNRFACCAEVREHKTGTVDKGRDTEVAAKWQKLTEDNGLIPTETLRLREIIVQASKSIQDIQASLSA